MKIWAHRGCSQMYPENTLLAFEKAAQLSELTGIELDIQLTRDGKMVVMHDEMVDRTTDGTGQLCKFSLKELKELKIDAGNDKYERIPTIDEVLDLLDDRFKSGLMLNIELKNSVIAYSGMEEQIIELVHRRGIAKNIIYSSFNPDSVKTIKQLDCCAQTGILDIKVSDCMDKSKNGCNADALHPYWRAIDLSPGQLCGCTVRAWFSGHLYPERPTGTKLDLVTLEKQGITDVFLNEPEKYIGVY